MEGCNLVDLVIRYDSAYGKFLAENCAFSAMAHHARTFVMPDMKELKKFEGQELRDAVRAHIFSDNFSYKFTKGGTDSLEVINGLGISYKVTGDPAKISIAAGDKTITAKRVMENDYNIIYVVDGKGILPHSERRPFPKREDGPGKKRTTKGRFPRGKKDKTATASGSGWTTGGLIIRVTSGTRGLWNAYTQTSSFYYPDRDYAYKLLSYNALRFLENTDRARYLRSLAYMGSSPIYSASKLIDLMGTELADRFVKSPFHQVTSISSDTISSYLTPRIGIRSYFGTISPLLRLRVGLLGSGSIMGGRGTIGGTLWEYMQMIARLHALQSSTIRSVNIIIKAAEDGDTKTVEDETKKVYTYVRTIKGLAGKDIYVFERTKTTGGANGFAGLLDLWTTTGMNYALSSLPSASVRMLLIRNTRPENVPVAVATAISMNPSMAVSFGRETVDMINYLVSCVEKLKDGKGLPGPGPKGAPAGPSAAAAAAPAAAVAVTGMDQLLYLTRTHIALLGGDPRKLDTNAAAVAAAGMLYMLGIPTYCVLQQADVVAKQLFGVKYVNIYHSNFGNVVVKVTTHTNADQISIVERSKCLEKLFDAGLILEDSMFEVFGIRSPTAKVRGIFADPIKLVKETVNTTIDILINHAMRVKQALHDEKVEMTDIQQKYFTTTTATYPLDTNLAMDIASIKTIADGGMPGAAAAKAVLKYVGFLMVMDLLGMAIIETNGLHDAVWQYFTVNYSSLLGSPSSATPFW